MGLPTDIRLSLVPWGLPTLLVPASLACTSWLPSWSSPACSCLTGQTLLPCFSPVGKSWCVLIHFTNSSSRSARKFCWDFDGRRVESHDRDEHLSAWLADIFPAKAMDTFPQTSSYLPCIFCCYCKWHLFKSYALSLSFPRALEIQLTFKTQHLSIQ